MRLACNAPAHLWDEFCATAAYLTNLTMSSSANGTTPHEKWFGTVPLLSHLHEIGCHAFSLIQTHNPKLFCRSTPCTLIVSPPLCERHDELDSKDNQPYGMRDRRDSQSRTRAKSS